MELSSIGAQDQYDDCYLILTQGGKFKRKAEYSDFSLVLCAHCMLINIAVLNLHFTPLP